MADVTTMTPLERAFHQECLDGSAMLKKQYKYNPTYFLQMVHGRGGLEVVRQLLRTPNFQDGLTTLWEKRQLKNSVEAAVLQPKWSSLFTDPEKTEARKRLKALHYNSLTDKYDEKS